MRRLLLLALAACASDPALSTTDPADGPLDVTPDDELVIDDDPTDAAPAEDVAEADIDAAATAAPSEARALAAIPADCPLHARVVIYGPRGFRRAADAFEANLSPCADYVMYVPALVADKTMPRGGNVAQNLHARAGRFFAAAGFELAAWKKVTGLSWYDKGVEFRRRMAAAGYDVARGDTWAINELPSTTRYEPTTQTAIRNLVRGLYDGPPGAPKAKGAVFMIGFAQDGQNLAVLKQRSKSLLVQRAFWTDILAKVDLFGQEAYAKPAATCDASVVVGARATAVASFGMHLATLASAGPAAADRARATFDRAYLPVFTASYRQAAYGNTLVSLAQMSHFLSTEVLAARSYAKTHQVPDGRIGFSWHDSVPGVPAADLDALATRLARAIRDGYNTTDVPSRACSPNGSFSGCQCEVAGAALNPRWDAFRRWD